MSESELHAAAPAAAEPLRFNELGDVIAHDEFPAIDLALRRGRHVHKGDEQWYPFLLEAAGLLEVFYRRYGCELIHKSDGYFFLLPVDDSLGKRQLSVPEMIVGQGLALAYLDPQTLENAGTITREALLNQLASVMGTEALMRVLNPKRRRPDERLMQRTVRQKVAEALRRLAQLGFVELLPDERLRLPSSLLRFAEPVRGLGSPAAALAQMLQRGEISLGAEDDGGGEDDAVTDADAESGEEGALVDASPALDGAQATSGEVTIARESARLEGAADVDDSTGAGGASPEQAELDALFGPESGARSIGDDPHADLEDDASSGTLLDDLDVEQPASGGTTANAWSSVGRGADASRSHAAATDDSLSDDDGGSDEPRFESFSAVASTAEDATSEGSSMERTISEESSPDVPPYGAAAEHARSMAEDAGDADDPTGAARELHDFLSFDNEQADASADGPASGIAPPDRDEDEA
jgi:chromosome partition protein MukE